MDFKLRVLGWIRSNQPVTAKEIAAAFPTAPLLQMERDGAVTYDPRTGKWSVAKWTPEEILAREG